MKSFPVCSLWLLVYYLDFGLSSATAKDAQFIINSSFEANDGVVDFNASSWSKGGSSDVFDKLQHHDAAGVRNPRLVDLPHTSMIPAVFQPGRGAALCDLARPKHAQVRANRA
jgi:hypothetical protein